MKSPLVELLASLRFKAIPLQTPRMLAPSSRIRYTNQNARKAKKTETTSRTQGEKGAYFLAANR